jgi:hypothetical protein
VERLGEACQDGRLIGRMAWKGQEGDGLTGRPHPSGAEGACRWAALDWAGPLVYE